MTIESTRPVLERLDLHTSERNDGYSVRPATLATKIHIIKAVRDATNCGLADAKRLVDDFEQKLEALARQARLRNVGSDDLADELRRRGWEVHNPYVPMLTDDYENHTHRHP